MSSLFDDILAAPDTTVQEERTSGDRVLSLFDDVLVGDTPSPPEPAFDAWYAGHAERLGLNPNPDDPEHHYDYRAAFEAGEGPDASGHWPSKFKAKTHPNRFVNGVDTIEENPLEGTKTVKAIRAVQHRPEMRWLLDKFQDGKWALGLAAQGLGVGTDVLRAFTQGEHVQNPEQFQARIQRGKTVFDVFKKSSIAKGLENIQRIEDPVERAEAYKILTDIYDISDPIDLMTEPKLRAELAELEFGLTQAPPFMTIVEMFMGNTRPALQTIPMAAALIPVVGPPMAGGLVASTFDLAKQLRKDPTEVTGAELYVSLFDDAQRKWMDLTKDLPDYEIPLLDAEFPRDVPALAVASAVMPAEIFYDPMFIAAESGLGAATTRLAALGVGKGAGAVKKGVTKAAGALKKKPPPPAPPIREPLVTPPPKPITPVQGTVRVPVPETPATPATGVAMASPEAAAISPRLAELRAKFQRSGVGEDLRFHHTSLENLQGIIDSGKIVGAPAGGSRENLATVFLTRFDVSKQGRLTEGWSKGKAKGFPFQEAFGSIRFVFGADDLKRAGVQLDPQDIIKAKQTSKLSRKVAESEMEETVRPRQEPKIALHAKAGSTYHPASHAVIDDFNEKLLGQITEARKKNPDLGRLFDEDKIESLRGIAKKDPTGFLEELKGELLLPSRGVDLEVLNPKRMIREIDSTLRAFGALDVSELGLDKALRVEIDPSLFAPSTLQRPNVFTAEERQRMIMDFARSIEEKYAIPVVIKPFFAQSEVQSFRPYIAEGKVAERMIRGPEPTSPIAHGMVQVANIPAGEGMTAAERAVQVIRETELPVDRRIGGVLQDMDLKGDPEAMGKALVEKNRPEGASPKLDAFYPSGPAYQLDFFKPPALPPLKGPRDFGPPGVPPRQVDQLDFFKEPPDPPRSPVIDPARLLPATSGFEPPPDISWFERYLSPRWVLMEDPNDALSRSAYTTQRRSFFDAMRAANGHGAIFEGMNALLRKAGPKGYRKFSTKIFNAINARPGRDIVAKMKPLTTAERKVVIQTRQFIENWLDSRGSKRLTDRGLLEEIGFYIWPEEEFLIRDPKTGTLRRAQFPAELTDIPVMDNALFKHLYPGMQASDDIVSAMRALSSGIIRQDILKPAWAEMRAVAKNLPPRKQRFLTRWVENLEGAPSKFSEVFDDQVAAARTAKQTPLYTGATTELTSFVLGGYYRGLLFGNPSTFFSNFFGQGFVNQAATHGAFRTFDGLAKHWQHAFNGVPKEAFMGGFEALFSREVPKSTFGLRLRQQPGIRHFRNFWNEVVEPQLGMLGSEFTNRSWAMHVGLADALDRYNIRNGSGITWRQLLTGDLKDAKGVRDGLMFEAMMHSDKVNHVWGTAGQNPLIRRMVGQDVLSITTQMMNWFPKQGEFLLGSLFKRGDPGILTNYILYTGWLSSLATRAWGIDFQKSAWWGSVPQAMGSGAPFPAAPPVDALWTFMQAVDEEVNGDPNQAERHWEELTRHLETIVVPGVSAREKAEVFWKSLETGGLFTPYHLFYDTFGEPKPRELLAFTGPTAAEQQGPIFGQAGGYDPNPENLERNIINILRSETPARAIGLPMVSDRQRRRIDTEIRRMNKIWTSLMIDLTDALLVEVQEGRGPSKEFPNGQQRFQELVLAAEKQGLPIAAMVKDQTLDIVLPRTLRLFEESRGLTKQMIYPNLRRMFPDYFEDPKRVWDRMQLTKPQESDIFQEVLE